MDDLFAFLFKRVSFMTVLGIDAAISGISGDMIIASLAQLVDDFEDLVKQFKETIDNHGYSVDVTATTKSYQGFHGILLELKGDQSKIVTNRLKDLYENLVKDLEIKEKYWQFGLDVLNILIETEKEVHDTEEPHLHELGTIDTIIDVVVSTLLLQELHVEGVQFSPVATGTGAVETAHGVLPIPAPVTARILELTGIATIQGPKMECTTPTGAAILYALNKNFSRAEHVIWMSHALGFGKRELQGRGNFLRVRLGQRTLEKTKIHQLETNLDDVTGEILGDTMSKILQAGALDVSYYPIFTKKNRPGYTLQVLCQSSLVDKLAKLIMETTGTLGIRIMQVERHVGQRKMIQVTKHINEFDKTVSFRVKEGFRTKIEFDDLARLAKEFETTPLQLEEILRRYL